MGCVKGIAGQKHQAASTQLFSDFLGAVTAILCKYPHGLDSGLEETLPRTGWGRETLSATPCDLFKWCFPEASLLWHS